MSVFVMNYRILMFQNYTFSQATKIDKNIICSRQVDFSVKLIVLNSKGDFKINILLKIISSSFEVNTSLGMPDSYGNKCINWCQYFILMVSIVTLSSFLSLCIDYKLLLIFSFCESKL